jgi:hypothetical protein
MTESTEQGTATAAEPAGDPTEQTRAYLAALPTEPDPFDPAEVLEEAVTVLKERGWLRPLDGVRVASVVALAAYGQTQGHRRTEYEHELRRRHLEGLLGIDLMVNKLVYDGVEFGARLGFAFAMAMTADQAIDNPEPFEMDPVKNISAVLAKAYALAAAPAEAG